MSQKLKNKDEYAEYLEEKVSQYLNHKSSSYTASVRVSWVTTRSNKKDEPMYFMSIALKDKVVDRVNMVSIGLVDLTVLNRIAKEHDMYLSQIGFAHHENESFDDEDGVTLDLLYVGDNANEHWYAKNMGKEYIDEISD